jgi:hypothetical protein
VADADTSDTADSAGEVPAWRRKLQETLASVQAQVTIMLCHCAPVKDVMRCKSGSAHGIAGSWEVTCRYSWLLSSHKLWLHALQMSEGAAVLRDSAQAAVGCDAAAGEMVSGE